MSIYTKTGDSGTTSLFGGKRASKADLSVEAYGSVDELSSFLGLIHAKLDSKKDKKMLTSIQKDLHQIMALLAHLPKINIKKLEGQVKVFEKEINRLEKDLPKLTSFILPQGGEIASLFHIARTVCRRAERQATKYYSSTLHVTCPPSLRSGAGRRARYTLYVIKYLNRLSDLSFMLARKYSQKEIKIKS